MISRWDSSPTYSLWFNVRNVARVADGVMELDEAIHGQYERCQTQDRVTIERTQFSNPDLLRGVKLSKVIKNFGALLDPEGTTSNNAGSSSGVSTYSFSRRVEELDLFLSHSWSDARWLKFLCLLWFQNCTFATIMANGATLVFACLHYTVFPDALPIAKVMQNNGMECMLGWSAHVFGLLFLAGILLRRSGRFLVDANIFLDKVCIHQTDPELKLEGKDSR